MRYGKYLTKAILTSLLMTIYACGGGGGGDTSSDTGGSTSHTSSLASSSTSSTSSNITPTNSRAISRADTPRLFSDYMDVVLLSKYFVKSIVNEDYYTGLADGTYTDSCEGGKGSYELEVSNAGNQVAETYSDCLLSVTDSTGTSQLVYNGKETAKTTRRENTDSTVVINWADFSVASPGETAQVLNGSLTYDGLLYFNPQITYVNVLAKIKTTVEISDGSRRMKASNVNLSINFPAIFDRYGMAGGGNRTIEDPDFHLITTQIVSATGSIELADMAANFQLSSETLKLNFSNSASAKAYAQATDQGFYLQWDEKDDGLLDANVFLTANKYSALSDNLDSSNNQIDFTRYDQYYPTLPPNHYALGQYQPLNLSRGASVEINVQEMFTDTNGTLLSYEIDNQTQSSDWEQLEAGRFKLTFPNSLGYETYELNLTAVDEQGNRSPVMKVTVKMNDNLADTDNDGILDIDDSDIDNDGVANGQDRFPKDASESKDTDDDGIGDNSDTDIDGDGVANADDAFPNDRACHTADSGDAYGCYLNTTSYAFSDGASTVYLAQQINIDDSKLQIRLIRFDTDTNKFLPPSPVLDITSQMFTFGAYNKDFNSILVEDNQKNKLYLLNLDSFSLQEIRDTTDLQVFPRLSDQGFFAVHVSQNQADKTWIEVYDHLGQLTDASNPEPSSTKSISFNFQRKVAVPFCEYSASINSLGKIDTIGDVDNADNDMCFGTNKVSQNQLYTFGENMPSTNIYNDKGDILLTIKSEKIFWQANSLIYINGGANLSNGIYKLDLAKKVIGSSEETTYSKESTYLDNLDIVGNKVVTFIHGGYQLSSELRVFDENLSPIYESTAH